jgi:hypothetical protein
VETSTAGDAWTEVFGGSNALPNSFFCRATPIASRKSDNPKYKLFHPEKTKKKGNTPA